jgi:hypothetical protein
MHRTPPAILFPLFFVFILAHPSAAVTGKDISEMKKAGVSDKTIELIVKEKVIETAAFSVDDIVNMKKAGVTEKTLRVLIEEGSFLGHSEPIVYGRGTQSIRQISVQDVINLKKNGVSDSIIQSLIAATKSSDEKDRERAWRMLESMHLRIFTPGGR